MGEFMATHPNAGADQIEQYLSTLDPGVANDIREIGWDTVVNEVDSRVLEMIRDPASRAELAERLGLDLESLTAGVEAIRRTVFGRRVRQMRLAS
ncbi:MAG: hypothetical protein M5U26_12555 [Planctomycetota bacterium]|nr:hypothetical protein [Planctomycetota bacterium]